MSNYTKITDYAAKDGLVSGNPAKIVKGTEIGADLDAVAVAIATKYDTASLGTNVATFLATPTSANLAAAVTNETGSGALVFGTSPTVATPTFTGAVTFS